MIRLLLSPSSVANGGDSVFTSIDKLDKENSAQYISLNALLDKHDALQATVDGITGANPVQAKNVYVYTSNGTWIVPENCTTAYVTVAGGGAGGAGMWGWIRASC